MSYHHYHHSMGEPLVIPPQPTEAEIEHHRAMRRMLIARIKSNGAVTREEVLYMFDTLPIVGCFGGPVPEYPTDVKLAAERAAPGSIVPAASVRRVYAAWNPGDSRY